MLDQSRDLQLCYQKYWDKAQKGDRNAMMYVADCYLYGWGVDRDLGQYRHFLNQAALMGIDEACQRLFYEALGLQDFDEVNRVLSIWKERQSENMSDVSEHSLAYKKTLDIYNSLASKSVSGMIEAFSNTNFPRDWDRIVSLCYQFGYGVEKNPGKATEVLIKLLGTEYDFEDVIATVLGMYDVGEITHDQIGDHLFDLMCKIDAFNVLVQGKYESYSQRLMIYAACSGNQSSQNGMAEIYLGYDIGIIKSNEYSNDKEAIKWLITSLNTSLNTGIKGKEYDNSYALLFLLSDKLSELKDYENAFNGWKTLAIIGIIPAQGILGYYYANGWGVQKDYMQAGQWWLKAAQNGDEDAGHTVDKIIKIGNGDYWTGIKSLIDEESQDKNSNSSDYSNSANCQNSDINHGIESDFNSNTTISHQDNLATPGKNVCSFIGLGCSIMSILTFCAGYGFVFGIAGIILGIIGLKSSKRGIAITDIIISGIGLLLSFVFIMVYATNYK
ncbi:MAG: sel1 repeat family protein [Lachnospiraceae bacterium]|nr:sel1 repeat family protein [Lachnospiraceae bacterium]